MKDEQLFLSVIHMWAATAWADGVLAKNEFRLLEGLINGAQVGEDTRNRALAFLQTPVDLNDVSVDRLGAEEREGVYRAACRMTMVDRHVDDQERAFLRRLGKLLALEASTAAEIESKMGL